MNDDSKKSAQASAFLEVTWEQMTGEKLPGVVALVAANGGLQLKYADRILNAPNRKAEAQKIYRESAEAFQSLGSQNEEKRRCDKLIRRLSSSSRKDRENAAEDLLKMLGGAQPAIPKLTELLFTDPDPGVRTSAIRALVHIPNEPDELVRVFLKALNDTHWAVQASAAEGLGKIGRPHADPAIPVLEKLLNHLICPEAVKPSIKNALDSLKKDQIERENRTKAITDEIGEWAGSCGCLVIFFVIIVVCGAWFSRNDVRKDGHETKPQGQVEPQQEAAERDAGGRALQHSE